MFLLSVAHFFSCGATQYSLLCVSVFVCVCVCLFSVFAMQYHSKKLVFLQSVQCTKYLYSEQQKMSSAGRYRVCMHTLYTVQLNCRSSWSPWAGLLTRQTQGRTINPKPYNRVARSLRTSEALIHLRENPQAFPSWVALGGPPWPMVSYDLSLQKTSHNWQRLK